MASFQKTEIGIYPDDWMMTNIGKKFDAQQGKQLSARNRDIGEQRPFLRTSNVFWGRLDLQNVDRMAFNQQEILKLAMRKGDLLVCEGGDIGRTAIWNEQIPDCCYQNHLHRLRPMSDDVSVRFFMYWMQYAFVYGRIYLGVGNKTTIPNLSQERLKALPFPCPEKKEQDQIATVLSLIQSAIENQENIVKAATELKKALMQKLFTEGLRGEKQKEVEIGLIPQSWQIKKATNVFDRVTDGTHNTPQKLKAGVPLVTSKNLKDGTVILDDIDSFISVADYEEINRRSGVDLNDILFSMIGTVGEVSRVSAAPKYAIKNVGLFKTQEEGLSKYCYYWLISDPAKRYIRNCLSGSNQKYITLGKLREFPVPLPDNDERDQITSMLTTVDTKLGLSKRRKALLDLLFQSTLNNLMSGQIRVNGLKLEEKKVLAAT